ncbi:MULTISPECIES: 8-oxoguanine deaminase [unclassified Herbaspirillum]|uniref:8-oxoguanine deaminase n=1 Tax=unclassified Herbaspirillum TaxID=2624150 RepID=UPI0011517245|nr:MULTISPECIES: 8-oxoguanine deaminase [unclassified Herbaspirillum]MBB5391964.1 cytosine/adenosine deaminase-related metal-dependent hydrolase [Herbaspirillum sp. SJZ102]TQK13424.1 cytosine/adenosine deaminase-related metal-dependent hydrolase [Herbaspirillum sp. SJZ130]TQK15428.1 cytosine/adenosine deaminase-related metal-dependent hydrolase [Herbaspirillum sp. SJZ106]TWC71323.1 cytosine/adenosine deaminase-related metal-dependent hydrolase [Herbaspirillum sp. SJZ099]
MQQAKDQTLLIKNAKVVVTMNDAREEIKDGAIFIRNNVIEQVGPSAELPQQADEIIDARHHVAIPGLVNTHHHMYQSLTRVIPAAQNGELFNWLTNLYPIWAGLTPEMIKVSTLTAMAELILSGCTTSSDHLYIYPNQTRLDDSLEAAAEIGMRFHGARGAMSVGQSKGGLPPDRVVEDEEAILKDTRRLIETYHDASRHAMQRIVVAPCSPFSVSRDLMREAANLARHYQVSLHTHLAENVNDIAYSREKFNMTPAEYAEDCGWVGHDVWHAHCVQLDDHGIDLFARTGTGVAHCPCSNMRLASGIAPIRKMVDAGVSVGLGVDGSASNDCAHMMGEVRQAMLLQRVGFGPDAMTARQALEIATLGGAKVLNRDDIGALKPGMSADVVLFDTRQIGFAGGLHDPVAALVFCTPANAAWSIINGRVVVREGQLATIDLGTVMERHNALSLELAEAAR